MWQSVYANRICWQSAKKHQIALKSVFAVAGAFEVIYGMPFFIQGSFCAQLITDGNPRHFGTDSHASVCFAAFIFLPNFESQNLGQRETMNKMKKKERS